ncbi:MAG: glycogen synthase GlgA [Rhodospirillales bacterium]|nr:glycogen synthase GlgA [Rhodospirillales bacterium]
MKLLFTVSEMYPVVKTGGLGDVAGALPLALSRLGADVRVLLPAYRSVLQQVESREDFQSFGDPLGAGEVSLSQARVAGMEMPVWLVDCPELFDRPGGPYLDESGQDWPDNHLRYATLCRAAAMICDAGTLLGWQPDVLHAHDWQAGLAPAYLALRGGRRPASVFSIHNMAFAGIFPAETLEQVGLPPDCLSIYGVEYHQKLSFLKAGIRYADRLTTVSPTHAREIMIPEFGFGFEGILASRRRDLLGILNGIDDQIWNPRTDHLIAECYDARSLSKKAANKKALQKRYGLPRKPEAPLLGVVSRFTSQKGIDLVVETLPDIVKLGGQLVVLGSGEAELEKRLSAAAKSHSKQVAVTVGYDEDLSHLIQAGCDLFLVPSRFEPCGLTQMYALRYGTLPIVRRTGGLADTVVDAGDPDGGTGFVFDEASAASLRHALTRAFQTYKRPALWRDLQRRAMRADFSWKTAAKEYLSLYRELLTSRDTSRRKPGKKP